MMKLTKKLEAEIKQVMTTYWDSYMQGDLKTWASFLPNDYKNIGTNKEETWHSKKEIVDYTKNVFSQAVGKVDLRNKKTEIIPYDPYIMVHELGDLYVKTDEGWIFYAPLRLTSLLKKTGVKWKVLHQHGSYSDSRSEEGEAFGVNELKAENKKLKDAVERRTKELKEKNRELEIDTSLEKVRAVAMGMKKREDMLKICKTISQQLKKLGVKEIRNVQTAIFYKEKGEYINYEFYAKHNKNFITEVDYTTHRVTRDFANRLMAGTNEVWIHGFKGKAVRKWVEYQKTTGVFIDRYLYKASSLNYYWYSLGPVAMGMSSYEPLTEDDLELFKQFRKVFELAYRRYLDIEKAEAQAREARIQTALERVRAVAMAMHKPEDLSVIGKTIFKELKSLGFISIRNTEMVINNDEKETVKSYHYSDYGKEEIIEIDYKENPIVKKWANDLKKANDAFVPVSIPAKEIKQWKAYRKKLGYKSDPKMTRANAVHYYSYSIGLGALSISSWDVLADEQIQLLERFRNVFELSYKRYIDIAKAEAQAKEALIEAALERVRARAMAMHQSDELIEVAKLLRKEMGLLGVEELETSSIYIFSKKSDETECWFSIQDRKDVQKLVSDHMIINLGDTWVGREMKTFYRSRKLKTSIVMKGANRIEWIKYCADKSEFFSAKGFYGKAIPPRTYHLYKFSNGFMGAAAPGDISAESWDLLRRATDVFAMAYTRFSDIKKAEAQAREAEIELALERVRARTMAMHRTYELQEVIHTVHNELLNLNISVHGGSFVVINNDVGPELRCWGSGGTADTSEEVLVPHFNMPFCTNLIKRIKKGPGFFTEEFSTKAKKEYFTRLFKQKPWSDLSARQKKQTLSDQGGYTRSVAVLKHTSIFIINHSGRKFTEAENDILKRFAKVFEQTYTRFLDLQKAEAQAREAEIEVALERVRARTMAMHKGDELADTALLLFEQMTELGIKPRSCGFLIMDEEKKSMKDWSANLDEKGKASIVTGILAYDQHPILSNVVTTWRKKDPYFIGRIHGKDLQEYYKMVTSKETTSKAIREKVLAKANSEFTNSFYFGYGMVYVLTPNAISDQEIDIMLRFAKVFEQTYTRFLDLQKAETQAREAQIETALERVRSRSLAMHNSKELNDVVMVLFERLKDLGIPVTAVGITTFLEGSKDMNIYVCGDVGNGLAINHYLLPYFNHRIANEYYNVYKKQLELFVGHYSKEEKNSFYKKVFKLEALKDLPVEIKKMVFNSGSYTITMAGAKNSMLAVNNFAGEQLSQNEIDIVKRFAKVFDQAYIRFLDLQKAEAQAREAEIELALERVRARTMSMHKSEELAETASVLFQQLLELDLKPVAFGFIIMDEKAKSGEVFISADGTVIPDSFVLPYHGEPAQNKIFSSWKKGEPYVIVDLKGKKLETHLRFIAKNMPVFDMLEASGTKQPDRLALHMINFRHGCLGINYPEPNEAVVPILIRFAKVFEQTYTRFLDLQKAEAQARESQIQLALERVRARTMAMHKSEELPETSHILFEQMKELGEPVEQLTIGIIDEVDNVVEISATLLGDTLKKIYHHSIDEPYMMNKVYKAWKKHQKTLVVELRGDELNAYNKYRNELTKSEMFPTNFGKEHRRIVYAAFFSKGMLALGAHEPRPSGSIHLLERFASVFELTYTRFLDLQKAEAQAREAQIEASLERIRSRTMGMQVSSELKEIVALLYEECNKFGFASFLIILNTRTEKEDGFNWWLSTSKQTVFPQSYYIPDIDEPVFEKIRSIWRSGKPSGQLHMSGKVKAEHDRRLFSETGLKELPGHLKEKMISDKSISLSIANMKNGFIEVADKDFIAEDQMNILVRYAKVFEQTYSRFLDLKKAEAQAKEAKIEAALERVRSRSLAMHHSSELSAVVETLLTEFTRLEFTLTFCIINLINEQDRSNTVWAANPETGKQPESYCMKFEDYPFHHAMWNAWKNQEKRFIYTIEGEEKKIYDEYLYTDTEFRRFPKHVQDANKALERYVAGFTFFKYSGLQTVSENFISEEDLAILERFGRVFEQSYTRFLDLQKAEEQARKSQIDASLERVRAHAMGLRKSEELENIITVIFEELQKLGLAAYECSIFFRNGNSRDFTVWGKAKTDDSLLKNYQFPFLDHPILNAVLRDFEQQIPYREIFMNVDDIKSYGDLIFSQTVFRDVSQQYKDSFYALKKLYAGQAIFKHGFLEAIGIEPLPGDFPEALKRFSQVIDLAYTRFLDLKKVEAQAREAQIEAALERVRSHSMGMQKSTDLANVTTAMFEQLRMLGGELYATGIVFCDKHKDHVEQWHSVPEAGMLSPFIVPVDLDYIHQYRYDQWKKGVELFSVEIPEDFIAQHFETMFKLPSVKAVLEDFASKNIPMPETPSWEIDYGASFKQGYILISALKPLEETSILPRFAKVFEQAYTRFLDLQKAEAQVREAQIEAALERVRSRSLAMHSADELQEVVLVIVEKLQELGVILDANGITLCTYFPGSRDVQHWIASPDFTHVGKYLLPYFDHVIFREAWHSKESGDPYFSKEYSGEEKNSFFKHAFEYSDYKKFPEDIKQWILQNDKHVLSFAWQKNSAILIPSNTGVVPTEAEKEILIRFSKVFEQAYVRFMDLQKAEVQAREAQIEAALERVRSRSMAMHHTSELQDVINTVHEQLTSLNIAITGGAFIGINEENKNEIACWGAGGTANYVERVQIPFFDRPIYKDLLDGIQKGPGFFMEEFSYEEKMEFFEHLFKHPPYSEAPPERKKEVMSREGGYTRSCAVSKFTSVFIINHHGRKFTADENNILARFANVFEQSYTRFLDLQRAEAQTREAQIEAALEKVRSRTLAMQKSDELADTSMVIFEQLINLGIAPNRLFIGIINKETKSIEAWATNEDGTKIGTHFTLDTNRNESVKKMYVGWEQKLPSITIDMEGSELQNYFHYLADEMNIPFKDGLAQKKRVQTIAYFGQGLIGMASPDEQPESTNELLERFAAVFNLTYTRFSDLKIAEAHARQAEQDLIEIKEARKKAEKALSELQSTQKQLIQSEKMASLGELTAGIAHEIQNPLNFVNNFSDVSNELIQEMKEELEKGNAEDALAIAEDVRQNLEKILQHGKRADGIVKGMLQHSRSSSGQKELTDINVLTDEYLRLAYHGLRAKDKSFNAKFETHFDENIEKLNIVPQDIGRVILNLINNAFYAVNEKLNAKRLTQNAESYEPTVIVGTKKVSPAGGGKGEEKIEISVQDNGNGIPDAVKEKIFQPFFTTKPTGEGTGLGLSLSYDIIKAHAGEFTVETKEGEGTTFTISLPVNQ